MTNTWNYRADLGDQIAGQNLDGYDVEASDGGIGRIDEHSDEAGAGYVVVDTGFWIFGTKRLVPAGVIRSIDHAKRTVHVGMTKDEIRSAPDFDETSRVDASRRSTGDYYRPWSW